MRITSKRFYGIIALAVLVCLLGGGTRSIGMNRARMRS